MQAYVGVYSLLKYQEKKSTHMTEKPFFFFSGGSASFPDGWSHASLPTYNSITNKHFLSFYYREGVKKKAEYFTVWLAISV